LKQAIGLLFESCTVAGKLFQIVDAAMLNLALAPHAVGLRVLGIIIIIITIKTSPCVAVYCAVAWLVR